MLTMNIACFIFIILTFLCFDINSSYGLSCKDENNKDVDWFIIYKVPKINDGAREVLSTGLSYIYLTSHDSKEWKFSSKLINDENSMLGNTWKNLKMNEQSVTYLFYNDQVPENFHGKSVGHLKGYLAFNCMSGFWIRHSIPRFGTINHYNYPETGQLFGQYAFCTNYKTSVLNEISKQLLYCDPHIYIIKSTEEVLSQLDDNSKSLFTVKPAFIRSKPFLKISHLESVGKQNFVAFAKDNQLMKDLHHDIIAQNLKSSLHSETWRREPGHILPPDCQSDFTVTNVQSIQITAITESNENISIHFNNREDHCKWSVSVKQADGWICFADLNRMESQGKRGGGAICFQHHSVWKNFNDIITKTDTCPVL